VDILWGVIEHDLPALTRCVRAELGINLEPKGRERDTGLDIDP
jgi:hypothetical protein